MDRVIDHLKLTFVAEKPSPSPVFIEVALMAAEERAEVTLKSMLKISAEADETPDDDRRSLFRVGFGGAAILGDLFDDQFDRFQQV